LFKDLERNQVEGEIVVGRKWSE